MFYERFFRPLIFHFTENDPEIAHSVALPLLDCVAQVPCAAGIIRTASGFSNQSLAQEISGLRFKNPIGLAAGFDKDARAIPGLSALGFGFVEVGTVVRYPQDGNKRPRVTRFPDTKALANRMGFPSEGANQVSRRLISLFRKREIPIGVSIGKSKKTPIGKAPEEYLETLRKVYLHADYIAINISSPNTPGLLGLHEETRLAELLTNVVPKAEFMSLEYGIPKRPIMLKITPSLTWSQLDDVLDVSLGKKVDGFIAINTKPIVQSRRTSKGYEAESCGLSGRPIFKRALDIVGYIRQRVGDKPLIIGVGGIFTGDDAYRMMEAGANLVQVFTSFIYRGPFTAKKINRELTDILHTKGITETAKLLENSLNNAVSVSSKLPKALVDK